MKPLVEFEGQYGQSHRHPFRFIGIQSHFPMAILVHSFEVYAIPIALMDATKFPTVVLVTNFFGARVSD
jgi:hypothetical protein